MNLSDEETLGLGYQEIFEIRQLRSKYMGFSDINCIAQGTKTVLCQNLYIKNRFKSTTLPPIIHLASENVDPNFDIRPFVYHSN